VNEDLKDQLLGRGPLDEGCDAGMTVVDQYVEAVLRGEDAEALFPGLVAHMAGCAACREDIEGIIAALRDVAPPTDTA
jgi:hypothetical protein